MCLLESLPLERFQKICRLTANLFCYNIKPINCSFLLNDQIFLNIKSVFHKTDDTANNMFYALAERKISPEQELPVTDIKL